jgi:hypothetical protein
VNDLGGDLATLYYVLGAARPRPTTAQAFLLAALLVSPRTFEGQDPPPQPPHSFPSGGAAIAGMPPEEIFSRLASTWIRRENGGRNISGALLTAGRSTF